jgi:predicted nucleic acid-binding protein
MPDRAYFDSCLFIELLQQSNAERFDACEDLRIKAQRNELVIVTSTLALVEVQKLPETGTLPEEQSKKILDFFANPYIVVRPVDRHTAETAHQLTRTNGLACNDAIHVATALIAKAQVLYTYDVKKGKRKGLLAHHLKLGNPPLRIEVPPKPSLGPLFGPTVPAALPPPAPPPAETP